MKANHNKNQGVSLAFGVVSSTTKIVKWKQITTYNCTIPRFTSCFQYDKDSKMKANHNSVWLSWNPCVVVSSTTKIVKWKQITTVKARGTQGSGCFQYDKDSKMKANHNRRRGMIETAGVVSSTTKIVKWKQITTYCVKNLDILSCFQYDKDSKMKANHNLIFNRVLHSVVVSSTTKIVKWKQITTKEGDDWNSRVLFPVRQR